MSGITDPEEKPAGRGVRMALGQLLLCPQCIGLWVAAGLTSSMLAAPRPGITSWGKGRSNGVKR